MKTKDREIFSYATPMAAFEIASATTRAMLHSMSVWNAEMAKFIGHRLEMDAKLQDELSRATEPAHVLDAMSKFYHAAFADYREEGEKLGKIAVDATEESLVSMEVELNPNKAPSIE